ncbi:GFA family protein [Gemmobacter serpentinus]|uniref:GFA family protein n=1 Tax=Gemmobacter serpentinus TaxID=2652247 RepID=UPI00124D0D54|nr:GFA family protein [Gemmobacter serpentinus]
MYAASCCSGAVAFTASGPPTMMGTCHCSRCRKLGASTIAFVRRDDLHWQRGQEHVAQYQPEAPYTYARCFCRLCGTALGEILSQADSFPIPANVFDGDIGLPNQFHVYVSEKPEWSVICDGAPQYATAP